MLKENEIYYGIGIHGEEGYRKERFESSEMLARELISKLKLSFGFKSQDTYAVLVNSLGEVTKMEQLIFNNDVCELLEAEEISIGFDKAGTFLTSFGIKGISLTLLKIEDENWLKALKTKVDAPNGSFWRSDRFEAACVPIADIDARKRRMKIPPHKWLAQPKFIINRLVRKRVVDNRIGDSKAGYPHTCTSFFVFVQFFRP